MTTDNFHVFAAAVRKQFDAMAKHSLFVVDSDRDVIWERYLAAWPEGTNPMFRTRTEHDCSCCRGFIRNVGNVVAIKDGVVTTVWDIQVAQPYQAVADAMAAYVRSLRVCDVFMTKQAQQGTEKSIELIDGRTHQWRHFSVVAPLVFVHRNVDEVRGERRTTHQVLLRGVRELTPAAVTTVRDLIRENAIYRGAEHKRAVEAFATLQARFLGINDPTRQELLAWELLHEAGGVARFRNTAIGTLVQDLSEGKPLEEAVRIFESKVAPHNYKRPTALITKSMVEAATKTIAELGLEEALERRHARFSDVSVDAVLFVDNSVQGEMKGGLKNLLMEEVKPAAFDKKRAEEITIDAFLRDVLPKVTGLQAYLEAGHQGNFVSMTAPVHEGNKSLFLWSNQFAWSYDGNVTDSIKEKVKRAGGRVENVALRVSLAWYNFDDLDLHCQDPRRGHIYYGNKCGVLDVDMNVSPTTRTPVENMRWVNLTDDGVYSFRVNEFNKREAVNVGFEVEVEHSGGLHSFRYERGLRLHEEQSVVDITVKKGQVTDIRPAAGIIAGARSQEKWGVKTLELTRINSVLLSPNHWNGEQVGNKHWFFILEGCRNPEPTRGIYNEFLDFKLQAHRKVFEVLGDKTKCAPAQEQLSGVGFSSTKEGKLTVLATGPALNKVYTLVFGN